jgi:hypothetical protein
MASIILARLFTHIPWYANTVTYFIESIGYWSQAPFRFPDKKCMKELAHSPRDERNVLITPLTLPRARALERDV